MTDETAAVADFVAATTWADVPADVRTLATRMVLDTVGVTVRGADTEAAAIVRDALVDLGSTSDGPARVPGTDRGGDAADAAFLTGVQAHVHDYDDVHQGMGGHPSAPVLSALLPLADATDASGQDLCRAFVLGTEVTVALGAVLNPGHYERGWHPTAILGTVGAALGAGALLALDRQALRRATGLAVSRACGTKANFGTMTKSAHVGEAARAAVESARLADAGFTASEAALEADFGGLFDLFQGDPPYAVGDAVDRLGDDWHLLDPPVGVKPYPCCGSTHAAIDAALDVRPDGGLEPEDVERVVVTEHPRRLGHTDNPTPQSVLDAKFSVQYCVATALATGSVVLEDFTPAAIERTDVRAHTDRVETAPDSDAGFHEWGANVVVATTDGEELSATVPHPSGSAENPLSDGELDEKFRRCAGHVYADADVEMLRDTIRSLDEVDDLSTLLQTLSTA